MPSIQDSLKDLNCEELVATFEGHCGQSTSKLALERSSLKMSCSDSGNCISRILECGHEHVLHSDVDPENFRCPTLVKITLPCGHETTQKPCHINVKEWSCGFPCEARIEPCGHSCIRTCHVNHDPDHLKYKCYKTCNKILKGCSTQTHKCLRYCYQTCFSCQIIIRKKLSKCNHVQNLQCNASVDDIVCLKQCTKKIDSCGHGCKRNCYELCGGCDEMVMKTLSSCGHEVKTKCNELPNIKNCHAACPLTLSCGHPCKNKCNELCTTQCHELIIDAKLLLCSHKFKIECHLYNQQLQKSTISLLPFCREPCTAILECSHKCSGNCGDCAQGRIHVTCMEKCGVPLICGHECKIPCREMCQPCELPCDLKCSHNKCTKTCGEECTKCQENCARQCRHLQCTAKCGDVCTVPSCQEACEKKLTCSHPRVGFCGDPCPPLCRICNAEELTNVFFGREDEIDARFVLLDECKHVIENRGMEILCEQNGTNGIDYIRCPKCRTRLTSTQRYSEYIKRAIEDVAAVKRKCSGDSNEIQTMREKLQKQLDEIKLLQQGRVFATSQDVKKFVTECDSLLQPVNKDKRHRFHLMIGKTLEAKLTIAQNIGNIFQAQELNVSRSSAFSLIVTDDESFLEAKTYVEFLFTRLSKQIERITNQEIHDFKQEQERLQRIAQFVSVAEYSQSSSLYKSIRELLYQPKIYTEKEDKVIEVMLRNFFKKMRVVGGLKYQERLEIVQATGLKKGNWYKCRNGHIYAIGECGSPWQIGKCSECGLDIGGKNKKLLTGSTHANEMDLTV